MERASLILGIIGTAGTIYTLISTFLASRISIDVRLILFRKRPTGFITYFSFTNKSHLPIAINDVYILIDKTAYSCKKLPVLAKETTKSERGEIVYRDREYTMNFPINLSSLSGSSGFLFFQIPRQMQESVSSELIVGLGTNRRRKVQKKLLLTQDVLHTKLL